MGWFGAGNLGDEAMLEGLLRLLDRALGPTDTTVLTSDRAGTAATYGTKVIQRVDPAASGFRNLELVRSVVASDLVTLGGGDLIREQANGIVPARNWLSRLRVPFALRRSTALIGVSVGELMSEEVLADIRHDVDRIRLVAVRDSVSRDRLAALTSRPVHLMGDLALEALDVVTPDERPPSMDGRPHIGVCLREILGRGPSVAEDIDRQLAPVLASALDRLVERTGARIELIPFRTRGPKRRPDDDANAGEAVAALARTGSDWVRHPQPTGAAAFGTIASGLDAILAIRLHGAILGAAAGRRVIGIDYDAKVSGFLADLGVPGQVVPLDASADDLAATVERTLADAELEARIVAGVAQMRERTRAIEPLLGRPRRSALASLIQPGRLARNARARRDGRSA